MRVSPRWQSWYCYSGIQSKLPPDKRSKAGPSCPAEELHGPLWLCPVCGGNRGRVIKRTSQEGIIMLHHWDFCLSYKQLSVPFENSVTWLCWFTLTGTKKFEEVHRETSHYTMRKSVTKRSHLTCWSHTRPQPTCQPPRCHSSPSCTQTGRWRRLPGARTPPRYRSRSAPQNPEGTQTEIV